MRKYFNNIIDSNGDAVSGATVSVSDNDGSTSIYSDDGSTLISGNQVTTDSRGYFEFYAPNGKYQLQVQKAGIQALTLNDVEISDENNVLINGGTIDGVTIGGTTPGAADFTSLTMATGSAITGIDADDTMAADSDSLVATQKAIKAHVATEVAGAGGGGAPTEATGSPMDTPNTTEIGEVTAIGASVYKIEILVRDLSVSATGTVHIEVGGASGYDNDTVGGLYTRLLETGTVVGYRWNNDATNIAVLHRDADESAIYQGIFTLTRKASTNEWLVTGQIGTSNIDQIANLTSGYISNTEAIDRFRVRLTAGTFDAGSELTVMLYS